MMRVVIGAIAALAVGGAVALVATVRAGQEPPLAEVVRNLSNADFAVREAAQKRLREMPPELHDTLRDLAEREKDEEVRQQLLTRVDEIEVMWATDPPPISLHIHNVNDYGMAEALAKSLGEPLSLQQEQQGALYTLDTENKPFWEVYRALMLQHPVMLQTSYWSNDLLARIARRGDAVQIERHGGITVIAAAAPHEEEEFEFSGSHKPQPPVPEGSRKVSLLLAYVTDPRIDVLKYWTPLISSVTDEKGNVLLKQEAGGEGTTPNGGEKFWREAIDLNLPKAGGTRTVSVKGEVHMLVGVKSVKYEFADLAHRVGGKLQIGDEQYVVKKFEVADKPRESGTFDVVLEVVREGEAEREPPRCQILDADGRMVGDQVFDGINRIGASCTLKPVGPFKLVMTQAEKTKDWRIPFELKGVVVP